MNRYLPLEKPFALFFCVGLLFAVGCGDAGPQTYPVTGEVVWEGDPLPQGDVIFSPLDGGLPHHGKIIAGKFDLQAISGVMKVSILATREAPEVDPEMGMAPRVNYIPLRYNARTELTAEVQPTDSNHFRFVLIEKE